MSRQSLLLVSLAAALAVVVGCGGESGPEPVPPPQTSGQVSGRITGVADPTQYAITVDGRPVDAQPGPSGGFTIRGIPPGTHTIGCIGPGGMQGSYVPVRVRRGQTVNAGEISPEIGGQIAGMVTRMQPDGALEPLAQVEVVATSGPMAFPDPPGTEPVPVGRGVADDEIVISAFTDDGGSYVMKAVPSGAYDVSIVVPGTEPSIEFVWVEGGRTSVADFTLYPAPEQGVGTVEGTVTGEGAGALEAAQVTVTAGQPWPIPLPPPVMEALRKSHLDAGLIVPPSAGGAEPGGPGEPGLPPSIEVRVFSTLTDSAGNYSLNVPVGSHWIECWLDGWDWEGDDLVIERDKVTTRDFRLKQWIDDGPPPPGSGTDPSQPVWPD